jgi:hypothetical protein
VAQIRLDLVAWIIQQQQIDRGMSVRILDPQRVTDRPQIRRHHQRRLAPNQSLVRWPALGARS